MWAKMLQWKFLIFCLIKIRISKSIISMRPQHGNAFNYLSQERPLWVLEDRRAEKDLDINSHLQAVKKPIFPRYHLQYRHAKTMPQGLGRSLSTRRHVVLPKHYIYPGRNNYTNRFSFEAFKEEPPSWRRQQKQQQFKTASSSETFKPSMPIFDSVPNDIDANDAMLAPIFVYNGPKGELILNTMLSAHKYPMQEPVPGQILYPPTEPVFRPKPIVQRFRIPGHPDLLNLTLIPFYAHEAIVPRFSYDIYSKSSTRTSEAADTTTLATASPPSTVLYAAPASSVSSTISPKPTKKRRLKKSKHYAVYRSADEVHWRPTVPSISEATTPFPMVLANPIQNHRYAIDEFDDSPTTTPKPHTNFKLTYKDEDSQFQIVYVDESLEKPINRELQPTKLPMYQTKQRSTPKPLPLLSSHYSMNKEYYAFPVYTLGKLLKPDNTEKLLPYSTTLGAYETKKQTSKNNVDTWFIMNSRYKGNHLSDGLTRLSSKYVEVPPPSATEIYEDATETTIERAI